MMVLLSNEFLSMLHEPCLNIISVVKHKGLLLESGRFHRSHYLLESHLTDFASGWILSVLSPALSYERLRCINVDDKYVCSHPVGDGSCTVYFGPNAPGGKESNWIQTVPGKGWFTILRLYGLLEPWFNKTWRPGEIELTE